jgi:hypothetical protein
MNAHSLTYVVIYSKQEHLELWVSYRYNMWEVYTEFSKTTAQKKSKGIWSPVQDLVLNV